MGTIDKVIEKSGAVLYSSVLSKYRRPQMVLDTLMGRSLGDAVRGKVVLVTGASEGIGREVALQTAQAGATVLLVARTQTKLEAVLDEIVAAGGTAFVHACDMSNMEDIKRMASEVLTEHGRVDILVNNAGRSIRRTVEESYDRLHDFERTMQINYFGALQLTLALLPSMRSNKEGHIVNISSGGVQARAPRFSAYVASKAALDAFSDCAQSEVKHDNVHFTTIFMPLVRTAMIAPTKVYEKYPALTTQQAADMVADALIHKPRRLASLVPSLVMVADALSPSATDSVRGMGFRLFDEHKKVGDGDTDGATETTALRTAFGALTRGVHW